jgi:hypothetical protein
MSVERAISMAEPANVFVERAISMAERARSIARRVRSIVDASATLGATTISWCPSERRHRRRSEQRVKPARARLAPTTRSGSVRVLGRAS